MAGFWDSFSRGYHSTPSGLQKGIQMGMREEARKRLEGRQDQKALEARKLQLQDAGIARKQRMEDATILQKMKLGDRKANEEKDNLKLANKNKRQQRHWDETDYTKLSNQLNTTGRGTTYARNLRQDKDILMQARDQMNQYKDMTAKGRPMTKQAAIDMSFLISKLISGGVPAQGLVEATIYNNAEGDTKKILQYLSASPQQYYGKDYIDDLDKQLALLERNKTSLYNDFLRKTKEGYSFILDRKDEKGNYVNEDLRKGFEREYGTFIKPKKGEEIEAGKTLPLLPIASKEYEKPGFWDKLTGNAYAEEPRQKLQLPKQQNNYNDLSDEQLFEQWKAIKGGR